MAASRVGVVSAEEKQLLLERYLDIVWIDDVTESKCVRCSRVPIHHYVSNCLHLYCRNCRTVFSDGGHWKCPQCKEYVTELSDQDWQLEDTIYQIRAHCPNKKYGCKYQGQLKTIPGHLRRCEDTREAALPAEFKGITLDTVTNAVMSSRETIGEMRGEMRVERERNESNWNALKARVEELSSDIERQKKQQADVEQLLKDEKELRDQRETEWKQMYENNNEFSKDLKLIRWDLHDQKEQLAKVKPLIEEVKERCEGNWNQTQTIEKQMDTIVSNTELLSQRLNDQQEQATKDKEILNEREASGAMEIQQLKTQLQQQHTAIETMNTRFEEMKKELLSLKSQLAGDGDGPDKHEETLPVIDKCEVNLNGMRMLMGQTQMPHDELHSMTLLYQWHITDIKTKDGKWNDKRIESEVFALTGYDCGAKARLDTDGWICLQLIDSKDTNRPIEPRSMPKFTWVIESQSQTTQDKQQLTQQHSTHAIRTRFITFDQSLDYGEYINFGSISSLLRPPYVVSYGMKLSLYIEPPSMARSFFSNNGILLWRLDNYKERKQMEVDDLIWWHFSPYFYTSPHGYRVLIRLELRVTTVNGALLLVKGEHDSSLTEEFPHRLTVTLFNHTDQSKNLVTSQQGNKASYTSFEFKTVSASSLESGGYVADDSVLIKAVVEDL